MDLFLYSRQIPASQIEAWEHKLSQEAGRTDAIFSASRGRKTIDLQVYASSRPEAEALADRWGGDVTLIPGQDWAALAATQHPPRPPLRIRDALLVISDASPEALAVARRENPRRHVLAIPPEMAFGTGDHATTATCLRLLVDYARLRRREGLPWDFIDVGTGSGLLALAARCLGAVRVEAFDFDPIAVEVAERNAGRNGVDGIDFHAADLSHWQPSQPAQLVAANVFADVLTPAFPILRSALAPGGQLIISGILDAHAPSCLAAAEAAGISWLQILSRRGWTTALSTPNPKNPEGQPPAWPKPSFTPTHPTSTPH